MYNGYGDVPEASSYKKRCHFHDLGHSSFHLALTSVIMQLTHALAVSIMALGTLGAPQIDPLTGDTVKSVPMSWKIEVSPGRVKILNGTIEEAVAQAVAINPTYTLPEIAAPVSKPYSLHRHSEVLSVQRIQAGKKNDHT